MKIIISSGHGKHIRGAEGYLDEVDEARRVVNRVAELLGSVGVKVEVFHDDVSTGQSENLERIVDFHNGCERDLDVSVHFNAFETTPNPMGTEVLYVTKSDLAEEVSAAIADAGGFKDRGPKKRDDLYFLNNTEEPAILIETCFVDSRADADLYEERFEAICTAIAESIGGELIVDKPPVSETTPPTDVAIPIVTITVKEGAVTFSVDPPDSVKVIVK